MVRGGGGVGGHVRCAPLTILLLGRMMGGYSTLQSLAL